MTAASLVPIIEGLETDPLYAISVSEVGDANFIESNATGEVLTTKYGGVAEFFNRLNSQGRNTLIIQVRRSNGSKAFVNKGAPQLINLTPPAAPPAAAPPALPLNGVQPPQDYAMQMQMGLHGGLSAPEVAYRYQDYPKVERERDDLKAKVEAQAEKIVELKEKILEMRFDAGNAAAKSEQLNGLFKTGMEILPAVLGSLNGGGGAAAAAAMPGLGNPATSPEKQQILQALLQLDEIYEPHILAILHGISQPDGFAAELDELLKTHNLIE